MIAPMRLSLFGEFRLEVGAEPERVELSPRLQALISCLAIHYPRSLSRSRLAFWLWPDTSEEQARTNLRNLLFMLRRDHPWMDEYLDAAPRWVGFRSDLPITIDVLDFEAAIVQAEAAMAAEDWNSARTALKTAADLYLGDLDPEIESAGVDSARTALRQKHQQGLIRWAHLLEQARRYDQAVEVAERYIQMDPTDETGYLLLMRVYAAQGHGPAVRAVYQRCCRVLDAELGVKPSDEVEFAMARLSSAERFERDRFETALIGRENEWSLLTRLIQQSVERRSTALLVISGDPGIGKTHLAEALSDWSGKLGCVTGIARAYAAEGNQSLGTVVDLLRAPRLREARHRLPDVWLSELARVCPEVLLDRPDLLRSDPLTEQWQRQRLFDALVRAATAADRPACFVIDDLQWCDSDSLEWLHKLLRTETRHGCVVVTTVRAGDLPNSRQLGMLMDDLRRRGHLETVLLGPLREDETSELAHAVSGGMGGSFDSARLFRETEGNPLFVVEFVRAGGGFDHAAGVPRSSGNIALLPPQILAAINTRLAQLTSDALDIVRVSAVIGRAFSSQVVARAWSGDEESLLAGFDELSDRRIFRDHGGGHYDFSHDKIREVVLASIGSSRRVVLHRRIAGALELVHAHELDSVSGQIADHYEQAGDVFAAVPFMLRSARSRRAVFAHSEALDIASRTVQLLSESGRPAEETDEWKRAAFEELGDTQELLGHHDEAVLAYRRALECADVDRVLDRARLMRMCAEPYRVQKRLDESLAMLSRAEETLESSSCARDAVWWREWAQIHLDRMQLFYFEGRAAELRAEIERARDRIEENGALGQRVALFHTLLQESYLRDGYFGTDTQVQLARSALDASEQLGGVNAVALGRFSVGFALWQRRSIDAEREFRAGLELAERTGNLTLQARCLTYLSISIRQRGDQEGTAATVERALAVAEANHMIEYVAVAKANLAWLKWKQGKIEQARAAASEARTIWRDGVHFYPFQWLALWPLLAMEVQERHLAEAVEIAGALMEPRLQQPPAEIRALLASAIAATARDDDRELVRSLRRAITAAAANGLL